MTVFLECFGCSAPQMVRRGVFWRLIRRYGMMPRAQGIFFVRVMPHRAETPTPEGHHFRPDHLFWSCFTIFN